MRNVRAIIMVAALSALALDGNGAELIDLGDLPGGQNESWLLQISGDGRTAVGWSRSSNSIEAFRWTRETGIVPMGALGSGNLFYSNATDVNFDGSVIAGLSQSPAALPVYKRHAFRWTAAGGMVDLGFGVEWLAASQPATPSGPLVSGDGNVIAGMSTDTPNYRSVRWTQAGGVQPLGTLPGAGQYTDAPHDINYDGSVIVGMSAERAYKWTAATGMQDLGLLPGWDAAAALGVSNDGKVIVGKLGSHDEFPWSSNAAFKWVEGQGMTLLPKFTNDPFYNRHVPLDVSADGKIAVGSSGEGVIWDENGVRSLTSILAEQGVDLTGWKNLVPTSISADGSTVGGTGSFGLNHRAFVAVITPLAGDADGNGVVNHQDFMRLWNSFDKPGNYSDGDFNSSGVVDFADYQILQRNWGMTAAGTIDPTVGALTAVPEPATLALLGAAGMLMLRRRVPIGSRA